MQLPAFFGKKKAINLLPRDTFEASSIGVVLSWVLAFGKWTVILTQLVVMGAFLWRFGLDRQLTDYKKQIAKNVAIVKSYDKVERDFLIAQKRVNKIKEVVEQQERVATLFNKFIQVTPQDVWYDKLGITPEGVGIVGYSKSLLGFSQLLATLQKDETFKTVSIGKIQDGGAQNARMQFEMNLGLGAEEKKK